METIKNSLLDAVVNAVSSYGVEGVSTRNVATLAGVCDTNIYRFFNGKEDMLYEAYVKSSSFVASIMESSLHSVIEKSQEKTFMSSVTYVFSNVWNYLLKNKNVCNFHVYYRNSISFNSRAKDYEYRQIAEFIKPISYLFRNETEAYMCICSVLQLIYMFAQKVLDETLLNTKQTAERILFQVVEIIRGYTMQRIIKEA